MHIKNYDQSFVKVKVPMSLVVLVNLHMHELENHDLLQVHHHRIVDNQLQKQRIGECINKLATKGNEICKIMYF